MNISLNEHRQLTYNEITDILKYEDKVCCVRYTGYGKTYFIIRQFLFDNPNKLFLIIVPRVSLTVEYKEMFKQFDNKLITTYQDLILKDNDKLMNLYKDVDYIICDECHHLSDNVWGYKVKQLFSNIENSKLIGLTATPIRADSIDVRDKFFNNISTSTFDLLDAIKSNYIPRIKYVYAYCNLPTNFLKKYDIKLLDVDRYKIENLINVPRYTKETYQYR